MTTLLETCKLVIEAGEKKMWAGAEFFPIKEFAAGLYLCRSPIKPDDKEVFVSDNDVTKKLARACMILMEGLNEYRIESTRSIHPNDCACVACDYFNKANALFDGVKG